MQATGIHQDLPVGQARSVRMGELSIGVFSYRPDELEVGVRLRGRPIDACRWAIDSLGAVRNETPVDWIGPAAVEFGPIAGATYANGDARITISAPASDDPVLAVIDFGCAGAGSLYRLTVMAGGGFLEGPSDYDRGASASTEPCPACGRLECRDGYGVSAGCQPQGHGSGAKGRGTIDLGWLGSGDNGGHVLPHDEDWSAHAAGTDTMPAAMAR
jgi:hypothetical protein